MNKKKAIVWFDEVGKGDIGLVGGKGANLGEMTNARLPVPYGFIVTSNAYFDFIKHNGFEGKIKETLKNLDVDNPHQLKQASFHIKKLIISGEIPAHLSKTIVHYYDDLILKEEKY